MSPQDDARLVVLVAVSALVVARRAYLRDPAMRAAYLRERDTFERTIDELVEYTQDVRDNDHFF